MAVTINASTTAGLVNTADTSGVLALQTSGTTALSISAAQVVTLTNALPVASGGSGVTTSTGTGANVLGTTPSFTSTIGVGGATASASGSGISFPATQSASSDVNTLDDYEEGTWTPVITAASGAITAYTVGGQYRKIGSLVVLQFQYIITNNGTGGSFIGVSNLPFAGTVNTTAGTIRDIAVTGVTGSAYFGGVTSLTLVTYNNGYPGGTNWNVLGTVCYQTT
jgi:hypothetical protein